LNYQKTEAKCGFAGCHQRYSLSRRPAAQSSQRRRWKFDLLFTATLAKHRELY
jgi:hypothetical protein